MELLRASLPRAVRRGALVGLVVGGIGGCDGTSDELPTSLGDCEDDFATWAEAEPVFAEHCTRCHSTQLAVGDRSGAPELINFDTPEEAAVNAFRTWTVIERDIMPTDGAAVPEDDKWVLWEWLSCGEGA